MRRKMDWAFMLIFMLGFASVTTEEQKEIVEKIPVLGAPPVFHRIERIEKEPEKNDAEIFWEVTKTPEIPPVVVDGNHPDNYDITTHDHVDQTIGHVPPTKRVKKILPPFDGGKLRSARHIDGPPAEGRLNEVGDAPVDLATHRADPERVITSVEPEENAPDESPTDTPTTSKAEDEIQGIRLVPNEFGALAPDDGKPRGEEGEEEGTAMQKSIWDLLKEREQLNANSTHLDGLESSGNDTETTRLPTENPKSLYEHFDADSAEVEFETENFNGGSNIQKHELPISYAMPWLQVKGKPEGSAEEIPQDVSKLLKLTLNEKSVNGVSVSIINSGPDYLRSGHRPSKWYLLLLTGNSTIVKLRRKDFTKYLKLNLAARLSVEYDDVKVNKVILAPPKVLVNISVFAPSDDVAEESQLDFRVGEKGEAPLHKLAETNATLLELSGEEYHVIRFLSFEAQKPEAEAHKDIPSTLSMTSRQNDVEFIIYTFLGSACACAALLTFFVTLNRYYKKVSDFAWFNPKPTAWKAPEESDLDKDEFNGVSPAVIYSGGFPQIRGSWMAGVGRRAAPPFRQRPPGFEMRGSPPDRKPPSYPDLEERPCSSPRHSKLQIYNCDADSLVIPMPVRSMAERKAARAERSDTHPLDVSLSGEKTGAWGRSQRRIHSSRLASYSGVQIPAARQPQHTFFSSLLPVRSLIARGPRPASLVTAFF